MNNIILARYITTRLEIKTELIIIENKKTSLPVSEILKKENKNFKKLISWKHLKNYTLSQYAPSKPTKEYKHTLNTKMKSLKPRWA